MLSTDWEAGWNDNSPQLARDQQIDCHVMQTFLSVNVLWVFGASEITVEQLNNFILHTSRRPKIVPDSKHKHLPS